MAAAAADVPLAADEIAYGQPGHARGEGGDRPAELMTDDPRRNNAGAGPRVPPENVKIRPTDSPPPKTLTRISPGPGRGTGTSVSSNPGPASGLIRAFMRCGTGSLPDSDGPRRRRP